MTATDLERTTHNLVRRLLDARNAAGHWEGRLASSALSTATAVVALSLADRRRFDGLIAAGISWLADHQNPDGGWGDTGLSLSNISTTGLALAALAPPPPPRPPPPCPGPPPSSFPLPPHPWGGFSPDPPPFPFSVGWGLGPGGKTSPPVAAGGVFFGGGPPPPKERGPTKPILPPGAP